MAARRRAVDERELTAKARAGDVEAFATLIGRYDRGLRALAYRLVGDRERMDDALQEAYLKAFRALPSFAGDSGFGTWLYRIVYNACLDELRRKRRSRVADLPLEDAPEPPAPDPDPGDLAAERHDLAAALGSLSPDLRAAVLLVDAEGMGYRAAAEVLGIPPGTIGSRLNRARAVLRRALGDEEEGRER